MNDEELVAAFESTQLDAEAFTHVEHVRVAWHYLRTFPLGQAIDRCRGGIRRFAATKGAPDKYHETVTVAFLLVINERLADAGDLSWADFAAANADLFAKPSVLSRYYSEDVLRSDRARRVFILPDVVPVGAGTPR